MYTSSAPRFQPSYGDIPSRATAAIEAGYWVDDAGYVFLVTGSDIRLMYSSDGKAPRKPQFWVQGTPQYDAVVAKLKSAGRKLFPEELKAYEAGNRPSSSPGYVATPTSNVVLDPKKLGKKKKKKSTSPLDSPYAPYVAFGVAAIALIGVAFVLPKNKGAAK